MTACRYTRWADRRRCNRADNPLPRPDNDTLLTEYASWPVPVIAARGGWNVNTVRSWLERAR